MNDIARTANFCDNALAELIATPQANAKGEPVNIEPATSKIDAVEAMMLDAEQIDCPVSHHFGAGVYIRAGFIPAGTYVVGHSHKKATMNVLMTGKMAILVNGEAKVIEGPFIFVSEPGRKLGYAIEDCNFQNIHATDKTDLAEIEREFIDKSDLWQSKQVEAEQSLAIDAAVGKYLRGNS